MILLGKDEPRDAHARLETRAGRSAAIAAKAAAFARGGRQPAVEVALAVALAATLAREERELRGGSGWVRHPLPVESLEPLVVGVAGGGAE